MDKDTRNAIERATQRARKILEEDFAAQLDGDFDVHRDGTVAAKAGGHLSARRAFDRERIVAAIEHKRAAGMSPADAARDYLRDAAFTTLNRFVALKMLEARELVQECITKGEQSLGYREFCGMAPGLPLLPDSAGYRLYVESLFDELSTEVKVLFDRRDPSSVLWPKRATFEQFLEILNASELARVWGEDETIGWVYQFFNGQDERKRMREESAAPRNGRELAVRNQFFTPRYVVQFLTDNTLGRIWYEMCGTRTCLAERCAYMVRTSGEEFRPRAKKDPRDLRLLDPACGSGHFLLYAFDLLLQVYEEAHADPQCPKSEATGCTLSEDYPSLDALRQAAPRLILERNLHGVDIDPRCAQIAQLALWIRAQKAYRDFGVGRAERPPVRRSNVVVGEPLIADERTAQEFVAKLGDAELGRVFTQLVDALNLAGDMGILLRIETLVARPAKRGQTGDLFAPPEERIRVALARFVRDDATHGTTRRRLFVDDAAHGVGLLSLAEKKFDVVLMNPPFGAGSIRAQKTFEKSYPRTKNDIFAAFVERGLSLLHQSGLLGAITSRTGFFQSTFQKWREEILLREAPPILVADLGHGVMDAAMVEASAYCLEKHSDMLPSTVFFRLLEAEDKARALLDAIRVPSTGASARRFEVHSRSFENVPGAPFAYWVTDRLRGLFKELPRFSDAGGAARQGLATTDDFRFLRAWWEVPPANRNWWPCAKGGLFSPFYAHLDLVIRWEREAGAEAARELKAFVESGPGTSHWSRRLASSEYYFRSGLTWPLRTHRFCPQILPDGSVISVRGSGIYSDDPELYLALFSSQLVDRLMRMLSGKDAHPQFDMGDVAALPIPRISKSDRNELAALGRRGWSLTRALDTPSEASHAFVLPSLLLMKGESLEARAAAWLATVQGTRAELAEIQTKIDKLSVCVYAVDDSDVNALTMGLSAESLDTHDDVDRDSHDDGNGGQLAADATALVVGLLSWAVGVAFGRFDVRLATGARALPIEPEPFDALPACAPGMLVDENGFHKSRPHAGYPIKVGQSGVLVDDPGHAQDLASAVRAVFDVVFGNHADRWWTSVAAVLDPKGRDVRPWLSSSFFDEHLKRHARSRRKAPVIWQLGTVSGRYSVWIYAHRITHDTFFQLQNETVGPKLAHEERRLESLTNELRDGATAAQRRPLAAQEALVEELRAFLDEVKRVAPLWNPNLDDGVIINFAPLWRLVPQNKTWQKELKSTWDALREGKYDWAHFAIHLWPERVVPKCGKDRSLAIAHGLEDVFWVEGNDGKWTARQTTTRSIDELVRERTSLAVKAALQSLLEAPTPTGNGRGGAGRRRIAEEGGSR